MKIELERSIDFHRILHDAADKPTQLIAGSLSMCFSQDVRKESVGGLIFKTL